MYSIVEYQSRGSVLHVDRVKVDIARERKTKKGREKREHTQNKKKKTIII